MDTSGQIEISKKSGEVKNGVPAASPMAISDAAPAPVPLQLPVMVGPCSLKGGIWVWEGKWAMTPAGISIPGEHSPFSYKCTVVSGPATPLASHSACIGLSLHRDDNTVTDAALVSPVFFGRRGVPVDLSAAPPCGLYSGHFMMQQRGHKSLKIDEKKIVFTVSEAESLADDGSQQLVVKAKGDNKFGSFLLDGYFNCVTGVLQVTKAYLAKVAKVPIARKKAVAQTPGERKQRRRPASTPAPQTPAPAVMDPTTPGGSGLNRSERKRSIPGRYNEPEPLPKAARLSENLRRCQAILKTLMANPLAYPFLVPVDHVALQIPDYPKIITHPMDLGTIQKKMNLGEYSSLEPFAADVRLVFKNALTFNSKDHVVHNMAKTLSGDFERMLGELMVKPVVVPTTTTAPATGGKAPRGRGVKRPAAATPSNGAGRKPKTESSTKKKPRAGSDSGNALVQALKDQLAAMTQKLDEVTAAQQQTTQAVQQQLLFSSGSRTKKEVDMNKPMTFEEKRVLSLAINKLPGDKLNKVIEIIQERMPLVGDGRNEIDVDISSLDTQTLRHLQNYVKGCTSGARKRKTPSKQTQAQAMRQAQQSQAQAEARLRQIDSQIQALAPSTPAPAPVSAPSRASEDVDVDTVDVIARQDSSSESSESDSDSDNEDGGANQVVSGFF